MGVQADPSYIEKHDAAEKSVVKYPPPGKDVIFWCTNSWVFC